MDNLFANVPTGLAQELVETLHQSRSMRIERIVSQGQASPAESWYDQDRHEWVVVLTGRATLLFEGADEPLEMGPGDYVAIPAHRRHRVAWTTPDEPTIWLAIHFK